jgi:adenylate cyclase
VQHRLAAVVHADIVNYSRLVAADEAATMRQLQTAMSTFRDKVLSSGGRVVGTAGDAILAEFGSAIAALQCAVDIQRGFEESSPRIPENDQLRFRIGINVGEVLVDEDDIFGESVNIAARIQAIAEPGGVSISDTVHTQVVGRVDLAFEDTGAQQLKNISTPVRVFRVQMPIVLANQGELTRPSIPSIAVLPFTSMSTSPSDEVFADGMSEDIITALSKIRSLFVIARNSTFTYKGRAVDVRSVARELGVRYVIEGSIRMSPNRIRITAQLIDADDAGHIWAERFDRDIADIFDVQDEITEAIVGALGSEIPKAERDRAQRKHPDDLGAWELYQRGMWHLLRRNRDDLQAAARFFEQSRKLDKTFSLPVSGLGLTHFFLLTNGSVDNPQDTANKMQELARAALAIDQDDPDAHAVSGLAHMMKGEASRGVLAHRHAVSLNPNDPYLHWCLGYSSLLDDQLELALSSHDKALRLSPRDPRRWSFLTLKAATLYFMKRFEESAKFAAEALSHPTAEVHMPRLWLTISLGQLEGRFEEARASLKELQRLRPAENVSQVTAWPIFTNRLPKHLEMIANGLRKSGLND